MVTANRWIKLHASRERALRQALRAYFADQAARLAVAVLQFDVVSVSVIPQIFRVEDEHDRLLQAVERPLILSYCAGAADLLERIDDSKAFNFGWSLLEIPWKLSQTVMQTIRNAVSALGKLPFWRKVQDETTTQLAALITEGIADGANSERIAKRIRKELGEIQAKARADRIGTTETTAAINAGHHIQSEELQREGNIVRKTWVTTRDDFARDSHIAVDSVSIALADSFNVGGHFAPYPGHYSLPARERINCRCGILSEVID